MKYFEASIPGVWVMMPVVYQDERGYFMESFVRTSFNQHIGELSVVQENESLSRRGTLRGLHLQVPPHDQAKLVRCVSGSIWDVVVDLRPASPSYGQHFSIELSDKNKHQLFIPKGFAHGFLTLSEEAIIQYKVNNPYNPQSERTILYNDPDLGIDWANQGVDPDKFILSEKDLNGLSFDEYQRFNH